MNCIEQYLIEQGKVALALAKAMECAFCQETAE